MLPFLGDFAMSILVVDDCVPLRETVSEYLRAQGYDVLEANDGSHALEVAAQNPSSITAVITDIEMPKLSGILMWEQMQQIVSPNCRVLFISGTPERSVAGVALPGELLVKPFALGELKKHLNSLLGMDG